MSIDLDDAFGAYSREELEETLRAMDPKKDPKKYAAIKAALSRALPQGVAGSCLDVAALGRLEVTIQPPNGGKVWAAVLAVVGTYMLTRRFLSYPTKDLTVYWVGAVTLIAAVLFLWMVAARKAVTAYRISNGTMECIRAGEITWQQDLSDLQRVEEVGGAGTRSRRLSSIGPRTRGEWTWRWRISQNLASCRRTEPKLSNGF